MFLLFVLKPTEEHLERLMPMPFAPLSMWQPQHVSSDSLNQEGTPVTCNQLLSWGTSMYIVNVDINVDCFPHEDSVAQCFPHSEECSLWHQAITKQDADPSVGLQEFFGFRHERIIVEVVEESYRDCLRCCERHSFDRLQADWEDAWPWHSSWHSLDLS